MLGSHKAETYFLLCHPDEGGVYSFKLMTSTDQLYYVYILTNYKKTVLYTGMTNNLAQRIIEHYLQRGNPVTYTGKYHAFYVLYYESFRYINNIIAREKGIKGWSRNKKEELINAFNPDWKFLNEEIFGKWPPD